MSQPSGRYYSVSYFRRLVTDQVKFVASVPSATIERRMNLARLLEARQACSPSLSWSAIFMKAYSVVAARKAALRTSYLKFPWGRFYEHPINVATLNVDRELAHERVILQVHINSPETRTLRDLDALIREYQQQPVESISAYRTAERMSRVPWPLRQWLWWGGLNVFGPTRSRHFGTFSITSVGAHGSGILQLGTLLTATLHYGMLDPRGKLHMRITFDHRVLDGAEVACALEDMETVLLTEILQECAASRETP